MKYTNPYKDIKVLDEEVKSLISDFTIIEEFEKGIFRVYVDTLGSGAAGIYLPLEVAQNLDIEPDKSDIESYLEDTGIKPEEFKDEDFWTEYEFVHEIIEEVGEKISKEINEKTKLPGTYYIGYLEADGSFGLFYTWEKGMHEEEEEQLGLFLEQ